MTTPEEAAEQERIKFERINILREIFVPDGNETAQAYPLNDREEWFVNRQLADGQLEGFQQIGATLEYVETIPYPTEAQEMVHLKDAKGFRATELYVEGIPFHKEFPDVAFYFFTSDNPEAQKIPAYDPRSKSVFLPHLVNADHLAELLHELGHSLDTELEDSSIKDINRLNELGSAEDFFQNSEAIEIWKRILRREANANGNVMRLVPDLEKKYNYYTTFFNDDFEHTGLREFLKNMSNCGYNQRMIGLGFSLTIPPEEIDAATAF